MEEIKTFEVDLPPFPVNALPPNLRDFVKAVSESVQVSPDMVAVPLLSILCTPLQTRFVVRIDANYAEPLCLYSMVIARPSERKSAVMSILTEPLWAYQSRINETLEKTGRKPITLFSTDATPEKLAYLMQENNGAAALFSDEPDAIAVAAGLRYGKAKNLGLMLQAWSAGRIILQRATNDKRVSLNRAVMSVAVMSQPSFMQDLLQDRDLSSRGFMQRFLYAKPLSRIGTRSFYKPEIPQSLLDEYHNLIQCWLKMPVSLQEIQLSTQAKSAAAIWFQNLEELLTDSENAAIEGWLGKLFGQTLRIAGILHCAMELTEGAEHEIDNETMLAAITIAQYFAYHAKAALTDVNLTQEAEDARKLYRYMLQSNADKFTKTELYHLGTHLNKARLENALVQLINGQRVALIDDPEGNDKKRAYVLLGSKQGLDESELW